MPAQIPARLLLEWLDGNQHRAYPLDESTSGGNAIIPFPLFVDALFTVTKNIDRTRLYISKLVVGDTSLNVFMSGYLNDVLTDFGSVAEVPLNPSQSVQGTEVQVNISGDTYTVTGSLVIGDIRSTDNLPAIVDIPLASGKLFPGCVKEYQESLKGIQVNGQLYTGIVTLESGDGVSFEVTTNTAGVVTVKINAVNYTTPSANTVITSDKDILREAINIFGRPVRSINNIVVPDDTGNINIVTGAPVETSSSSDGEEEAGNTNISYVEVAAAGQGAMSISLTNDDTVTSCNDTITVTVETLMDNVSNLNDRITVLNDAVTAQDRANSNLAIQLSRY